MKKNWYNYENGKVVLELMVDSIEQLFDKRDPNPFRVKDLDDDVVEYIYSSISEVGIKKVGYLKISTNEEASDHITSVVKAAFKDYFDYKIWLTHKKIKSTLKIGIKSFVIGAIFLSIASIGTIYVGGKVSPSFTSTLTKEWLLLLAWVSMWKPINIFLYEWWPFVDEIKIYEKISTIELKIVQKNGPVNQVI